MKKCILLLLLFSNIMVYGQDRIIIKGGRVLSCNVNRISPDSVYFVIRGQQYSFHKDNIKNAESTDRFKTFLLKNPGFYGSDHINLEYTNYCLEKFRAQRNLGYTMQFSGVVITVVAAYIGHDPGRQLIALGLGGIISLTGVFMDWGASAHLRNLSVSPDYQVGLGYYFNF